MAEEQGKKYRPWEPDASPATPTRPATAAEDDRPFFSSMSSPYSTLSRFYASYEVETAGAHLPTTPA